MNFQYQLEAIRTPSLVLEYFLVPWDTEIIGAPVATIEHFEIKDAAQAGNDYRAFVDWCKSREIYLCSIRLSQEKMNESIFLQSQGFRFIALNFRPRKERLEAVNLADDNIVIEPANNNDRPTLVEMASATFRYGRFHQDPRIGPALGNSRYRVWMENAFNRPQQRVFKCLDNEKIVGFFVIEYPEKGHCFWSLMGLAPGLSGHGLGTRVCRAMLKFHQAEGIHTVSSSITSHNIVALNLYVSLGFRFPQPLQTFHWCP